MKNTTEHLRLQPSQATTLHKELQPFLTIIQELPLYQHIDTLPKLQTFMEYHVFAVWDFMCLIKALYNQIVSTSPLWTPPKDGLSSHLIGSILVEEESDLTQQGDYASHFETYLHAMKEIGANTTPIETFLSHIAQQANLASAMHAINLHPAAQDFVQATFSVFHLDTHQLAAAFVFGREAITGTMFHGIVKSLTQRLTATEQNKLTTLLYYLERHIELDSDEHFPKALQMLEHLCGYDKKKWQEAKITAVSALQARIEFFSNIQQAISATPLGITKAYRVPPSGRACEC